MGYDNQHLDAEDEEMDEVTQALIQEDVIGKRQLFMITQSEDRTAMGLSDSHKRPRHECANKSVPFHAVNQYGNNLEYTCH